MLVTHTHTHTHTHTFVAEATDFQSLFSQTDSDESQRAGCSFKLKGVVQLSGGGVQFQRVMPRKQRTRLVPQQGGAWGEAGKKRTAANDGGGDEPLEGEAGAVAVASGGVGEAGPGEGMRRVGRSKKMVNYQEDEDEQEVLDLLALIAQKYKY